VRSVEYLGGEALVACAVGDKSLIARTRGPAPELGATVGLTWDAAAAHLFDAASGKRIAADAGATSPARIHPTEPQGRIVA
jgi:sn-glycerol 3-phosphate transport system ATP-binding protein